MIRQERQVDPNYLWGEFDADSDTVGEGGGWSPGLSAAEREALTRLPRPLLVEGPKIHQPGSLSTGPSSRVPGVPIEPMHSLPNPMVIVPFAETSPRDPYVIQGIQLLDYLQRLNDYINRDYITQIPPPPTQLTDPLPVGSRAARPNGPFSCYSKGHDDEPPEKKDDLDSYPRPSYEAIRTVLHKSTAALAAFSGFDSATDSALDLLTDAAGHFVKTICSSLLRSSRDSSLMSEDEGLGFSDLVDRTLTEVTGCGLQQIPEYYHHSIINRYLGIVNQCRLTLKECHQKAQLESAYPNMQPSSVASSDGAGFSVAPESAGLSVGTPQGATVSVSKNSEADNIPEIHFPSAEDQERGGLNTISLVQLCTPQMETGMQMLQSLEEQQANLDSNNPPSNSMTVDSPVPSYARTPSHSIIVGPGSVLSGSISLNEEDGSPIPDTRFSQQSRKRALT